MFVEFTVGNFKSIRQKQTLSLQAAAIVSKDPAVDDNNVFSAPGKVSLLKSVAIYGPNASGKSNLIKALSRMLLFIDRSFADEAQINLVTPFALDEECHAQPIHFELVFITNDNRYRYGFEITSRKVTAEWLFGPANINEVEYFTREGDQIDVNRARFREATDLPLGKTKATTLFLNVVHAFNGAIAGEIKEFLRHYIIVSNGMQHAQLRKNTLEMMENDELRQQIATFLRAADLGIQDIEHVDLESLNITGDPAKRLSSRTEDGKPAKMLGSVRKVRNAANPNLPFLFNFDDFESEGTKKFFNYTGPIIESLILGKTLVIDEFDSLLHPSLTRRIIELFHSKDSNPGNGQLIFVTHDINLLDPAFLRRDQIYFAEKNSEGETTLYSLINIGGVRNDVSYEREYMKGKYGALPYLEKFNFQPDAPRQKN